jgi:hypothetical protein
VALTPQDMLHKMRASIADKTGRSFEAWVDLARAVGIDGHRALAEHLRQAYDLNYNEAQWIAWEVVDPGRIDRYDKPDDLVEGLYSGRRAHLRPLYDRLIEVGLALGADVTTNVCKTYTSLSAGTQFAILNPRTQAGVDLELVLPSDATVGEPFKSSNPKFTRRLRVSAVEQIDDALTAALREAADMVRR